MFKLKFTASNKKTIEQLKESGLKKYSNLLTDDGFWIQNATLNEMKGIACSLNRLDINPIQVEIVGHEDVEFKYDDVLKKVFLSDLSEKWEVEQSVMYAINAFETVEHFEDKFNKSVLLFSQSEVEEASVGLFEDMRYYSLRFKINTFDRIQKFYQKNIDFGESKDVWAKAHSTESLKEILVSTENESVTREELFQLFNIMPNMQDSIIPILIFEGVLYSRIEEDDELRYIKQSDVSNKKIELAKGGDRSNTRVIEIDGEVELMVQKVMTQKFMLRTRFHNKELVDLADTEYLLKPMIGTRSREDNGDSISFRGAYNRFLNCKEQFEANIDHKNFTPKTIQQCGKAYYVSRFIEEGAELPDALRMTCKRFGDWTYLEDESKENGIQANRQRVARLKKVWEVYENDGSKGKRA